MAPKKSTPRKKAAKKGVLIRIAETIGQVAGEISVKKDQLSEMGSHVYETVKDGIRHFTAPKKTGAKKAARKAVKKAVPAKKTVKKAIKKAAAVKKR